MSRRNKGAALVPVSSEAGIVWSWTRRVQRSQQDSWLARLHELSEVSGIVVEKPGQVTALLTVYCARRFEAVLLQKKWGGRIARLHARDWLTRGPVAVLKFGSKLEVHHEKPPLPETPGKLRLHIPHGLAFGSGEHATTSMLLRSLVRQGSLAGKNILDLGTGSGVLAMTSRLLGATQIVATDYDAEAIRTARENELRNFRRSLIRWSQSDVQQWRGNPTHDLVLANLFSGILCTAAGRIAASVAPNGQLWLSGILHTQEEEVVVAYQVIGLHLAARLRRGKWILLQWTKAPSLKRRSAC